jgi:transcriptional regulator with XRE-family HTH domain
MIKIDGEKIKKIRESQGLTQLYMATVVEVTTDTISRWENKRYPTIKEENGQKLAEALGVTLDEILLEEDGEADDDSSSAHAISSPHTSSASGSKVKFALLTFLLSISLLVVVYFGYHLLLRDNSPVTVEATRIMPERAIPGNPFPVVIEIKHTSSSPLSIILKETLPPTAEILKTSPHVNISTSANEVKWLKKVATTSRFSYLVTINGTSGQEFQFEGNVSTSNGSDQLLVSGASNIILGQFHWADSDGDNQISDKEILTVFDYYSGIDDFTVNIEFIEKMWLGSRYSWDKENNVISISP